MRYGIVKQIYEMVLTKGYDLDMVISLLYAMDFQSEAKLLFAARTLEEVSEGHYRQVVING